MKWIMTVFAIGFIVMMANFAGAQDSLKIMSYNIHGRKPGTDPDTRLFHIIRELKKLDPDIIGIQEINEAVGGVGTDNQGQIIADSLSIFFNTTYRFYQSQTHLSWSNQFREFVGIITKYPVLQKGFKNLKKGTFPRKVLWNQIDTPLGKLNFFNTHLSFGDGNKIIRPQQVQQIADYVVQQEQAFPGVASIVTGDFNDVPDSPPIFLLTHTGSDSFFFDTFREVNPNSNGFTVPAEAPSARIDFIFSKSTSDLEFFNSSVVMNEPFNGASYPSDHLGVMTLFAEDTSASDITIKSFVDFGDVLLNTPKETEIIVANNGTEALLITDIVLNHPAFAVDKTSLTVSSGSSEIITISFTPSALESFSVDLMLKNNAGRDRKVLISGTGITFTVPAELGFGNVLLHSPQDSVIQILNPATTAITVAANITSGESVFAVNPANFTIQPESSKEITITFAPTSVGSFSGTLTFESNSGNPFVELSGVGVESASWSAQQSGSAEGLNDLFFVDANTGWVVGDNGTILKTTDGGSSWQPQPGGTTNQLNSIFFADAETGWVAGKRGTVLKTSNGGISWAPQSARTPNTLFSIYFTGAETGWVVGRLGTFRRTIDGGETWIPLPTGTTRNLSSVFFATPDSGWAVGENGTVIVSADSGNTWSAQSSDTAQFLHSVYFVNSTTGWIAGEDGIVLNTMDSGANWTPQVSQTSFDLFSIKFIDQNIGWMVGESGSMIRTIDAGNNWVPLLSGQNSDLTSLFFVNSEVGYISGAGGTILKTTTGGMVVSVREAKSSVNPDTFQLLQNYPNPFNPSTTLKYVLPEKARVVLKIYNSLGQEVRTLVNQAQNAGEKQVVWDGKDNSGQPMSAGLYIYRIQAGQFTQSKKLVLVK